MAEWIKPLVEEVLRFLGVDCKDVILREKTWEIVFSDKITVDFGYGVDPKRSEIIGAVVSVVMDIQDEEKWLRAISSTQNCSE